jgi:DNA/RNA endonuclease G (NUC1)
MNPIKQQPAPAGQQPCSPIIFKCTIAPSGQHAGFIKPNALPRRSNCTVKNHLGFNAVTPTAFMAILLILLIAFIVETDHRITKTHFFIVDYNSKINCVKRIIFLCLLYAVPSFSQHSIEVKHKYYTMVFDTIQSAELVGYYIQTTAHSTSQPRMPRSGKFSRFTNDPLLEGKVLANDKAYRTWNKAHPAQARDRGHVNPFTAFDFAEDAALESMYFSNTCPQSKYFNEHQWQRIEQYVLKLSRGTATAKPVDSIHVWTGVLIDTERPKKMDAVFEPDYYWKVIAYKKDGQLVTEAWLGLNEDSNRDTDPDAIKTNIEKLREMVCKYYPKLVLTF